MAGALPMRAMAFLRRASLLPGMLAIVAGILGMHIMTGPHGMTASVPVPGADMVRASAPAAQDPAPLAGLSCADGAVCTTMSAMDGACIPFPGNAPPAVPSPRLTPFAATIPATSPSGYALNPHLPGSPSPGDLCISRT